VKVAAFVGESGSGKTTAIAKLIEHFVKEGRRVGAIKHTHHAINDDDRGDTAVFQRAGAEPVILAGDREAVLFSKEATTRVSFSEPRQLLERFHTDIVFIEGFKSLSSWPRVELNARNHQSTQELLAILDRIWRP
jgi:molybdopterin-guanine dinucleotide biosynthesis protein B